MSTVPTFTSAFASRGRSGPRRTKESVRRAMGLGMGFRSGGFRVAGLRLDPRSRVPQDRECETARDSLATFLRNHRRPDHRDLRSCGDIRDESAAGTGRPNGMPRQKDGRRAKRSPHRFRVIEGLPANQVRTAHGPRAPIDSWPPTARSFYCPPLVRWRPVSVVPVRFAPPGGTPTDG